MVNEMIERLALYGHAELVHGGKVRLRAFPGLIDLFEEDLLRRILGGPPVLDPSLKGAELAVSEASRVTPLQILEEGLGFEARIEFELLPDLLPAVGKEVVVCTPLARGFKLAGKLLGLAILAGGLLIETGLGGGHGQGLLLLHELE